MKITNALIAKFLADRCNNEEAEAVYTCWKEHPELRDAILPEREWDEILASKPTLKKSDLLAIRKKWQPIIKDTELTGSTGRQSSCASWKWMIFGLVILIFVLMLLSKLFNKPQKEALLSAFSCG